jgi:hypothetical protein
MSAQRFRHKYGGQESMADKEHLIPLGPHLLDNARKKNHIVSVPELPKRLKVITNINL